MEWSDDEAEAQAKKRRKNGRSGSTVSARGRGSATPQLTPHGLPSRPHFDYQGPDETYAGSETGSMYGGDEEGSVYGSEAGSTTSVGRRPVSYDDLEDRQSGPSRNDTPSRGHGRGGSRGNQRGQGRERGRGRGRGDGRGRNGNRRDERPKGQGTSHGPPSSFGQHQQQYPQFPDQYQQHQQQPQYQDQVSFQQNPYQDNTYQQQPYQPFPAPVDSYSPNQPYNPPMHNQQQFQSYPHFQSFQQFMPQPGGPAINPRFSGQTSPMNDQNRNEMQQYNNNHWGPQDQQ